MSETSPPLRLMPADGTVFRRVVLEELNSSLLSFSRNFDPGHIGRGTSLI